MVDADSRRVLVVFGSVHAMATYRRRFFGARETSVTTHLIPNWLGWRRTLQRAREECSLVVMSSEPPAEHRREALRVPRLVPALLFLAAPLDELKRSLGASMQADFSRFRKASLSSRVCTDSAWVDEFDRRFHQPSMQGRHQEGALHTPVRVMKDRIREGTGEFVQIMHQGDCVAATFCERTPEGYRMRGVGWRDGSPRWFKLGAVVAAYWMPVERAHALGFTMVDFGGSPSYLESGLLQFKLKFGTTVRREDASYIDDYLFLNHARPGTRDFLERHSFFAWDADGNLEIHSTREREEMKLRKGVQTVITRWHRWPPSPAGPAPTAVSRAPTMV